MIQTNVGRKSGGLLTQKSLGYSGTLKHTPQEARSSTSASTISVASPQIFCLARAPYLRTFLHSSLLLGVFLMCGLLAAVLGAWLWPTYSHAFTPYLKWQDVLVASCWYLALLSVLGCAMALRFLIALHTGYRQGMLNLVDTNGSMITVRDLSQKNLPSIIRAIYTAYACFLAVLTGLLPATFIGWTVHLPHLALAVLATTVAIVLCIAGLVIALPAFSFMVIGWIGSISFARKLGAPQSYKLTGSTTLMIDDFELVVIYPDGPEAVIDLNLLDPNDQHHLLYLLRKRWLDAQSPWNPHLGEEIEGALQETQRFTILV
jgi:hypothetical protein